MFHICLCYYTYFLPYCSRCSTSVLATVTVDRLSTPSSAPTEHCSSNRKRPKKHSVWKKKLVYKKTKVKFKSSLIYFKKLLRFVSFCNLSVCEIVNNFHRHKRCKKLSYFMRHLTKPFNKFARKLCTVKQLSPACKQSKTFFAKLYKYLILTPPNPLWHHSQT